MLDLLESYRLNVSAGQLTSFDDASALRSGEISNWSK